MGIETSKILAKLYQKASGRTAPCLNNDLDLTPRDSKEYMSLKKSLKNLNANSKEF